MSFGLWVDASGEPGLRVSRSSTLTEAVETVAWEFEKSSRDLRRFLIEGSLSKEHFIVEKHLCITSPERIRVPMPWL